MSARRSVLFSALLFTPLAAATSILWLFLFVQALTDGAGGGDIFLLVILAVVSLLLLFQAITALLDLRADITSTEGTVLHKWSRNDFIVFGDSCYLRVGPDSEKGRVGIFKIDRFWWEQMSEGDRVLVKHYPHTAAVESIEKL